MKATGLTTIKDIQLNSPTLTIKGVNYNWETKAVFIELIFKEEGGVFEHSRTYEFSNPTGGELGTEDIIAYINNDAELSVFE